MRDPRNRNAVRFDPSSMDLRRLAGGSDVNAPTVSPSMATALLAYSGIGVKMLVDQQVGAQLHTMFVVDYQPTAIAHPHDHPFEEAYVFVEGEVHALVDGELVVFHPGDVLWAGVGADHGFENRGSEPRAMDRGPGAAAAGASLLSVQSGVGAPRLETEVGRVTVSIDVTRVRRAGPPDSDVATGERGIDGDL